MNINIKNMVCNRCIFVVGQIFKNAGANDAQVQLGKVILKMKFQKNSWSKLLKT